MIVLFLFHQNEENEEDREGNGMTEAEGRETEGEGVDGNREEDLGDKEGDGERWGDRKGYREKKN